MVVDSVKTEAVAEEGSRERDLPKALVKPQVLTHVIEGYVIQEGECQSGQLDLFNINLQDLSIQYHTKLNEQNYKLFHYVFIIHYSV